MSTLGLTGSREIAEKTDAQVDIKNKSSKGKTQTESRKFRVTELEYTANLALDRCWSLPPWSKIRR